jgi:acetoin utilization deacetylase AcuC-like enzyme
MPTAFFTDERFASHTFPGHPEHAGRLEAVVSLLKSAGMWDRLQHVAAVPANQEQLLLIHEPRYLDALAVTAQLPFTSHMGADTYITPDSYHLAQIAAGGVIAVVDSVMGGETHNGMACVRPPGHHARPQHGMGFCLLNNIAIAARHALKTYQLERVAIVDFDVHHGNGTQDALYDDPQVLFISSHQSPFYPGTGAINQIGSGAGKGFTVNIPVPAGTGDASLMELYNEIVAPILQRYKPQLLLVSAGFDAHFVDPLAQLQLSLVGYDYLTRLLIRLADALCDGRIVFVMEGGYDLTALSHGWLNIANALLGMSTLSDPLGLSPYEKPPSPALLEQLKVIHQLKMG